MIISRTPFRISFFGGGTDYPAWYLRNGGAVISTTFDKYCYVTCRELPPFFDHKYRIAYSKIENVKEIGQIEHRAIRAVLKQFNLPQGLEIHCDADLPARSGLGSSSSFVVGLLNCLKAFQGKRVSQDWLTHNAIKTERELLKETVGSQDQAAAAYGGFNQISFSKSGDISVTPIVMTAEKKSLLNDHLMLFYTGVSRISSDVATTQVANIDKKVDQLHRMRAIVDEGVDILTSETDIRAFGELLDASWKFKRTLSDKVSNFHIDELYETATRAGAIGGKILGAGGGGFLLLFVEPEKQDDVKKALGELVYVPFKFENSGSQIIYYRQ